MELLKAWLILAAITWIPASFSWYGIGYVNTFPRNQPNYKFVWGHVFAGLAISLVPVANLGFVVLCGTGFFLVWVVSWNWSWLDRPVFSKLRTGTDF